MLRSIEEELAILYTDRGLKITHNGLSLEAFLIYIKENMSQFLTMLLQFSTSYLCDLGFSTLTTIKCRDEFFNVLKRNEFLSNIRPNIKTHRTHEHTNE